MAHYSRPAGPVTGPREVRPSAGQNGWNRERSLVPLLGWGFLFPGTAGKRMQIFMIWINLRRFTRIDADPEVRICVPLRLSASSYSAIILTSTDL